MTKSSNPTMSKRRSEVRFLSCLLLFFLLLGTSIHSSTAFTNTPSTTTIRTLSIKSQLYTTPDSDADKPRKKSLAELLTPIDTCKVNQMSGTDLAYIGDVVFELFIRSRHVWPSKRTSDLQNTVVAIVRAEHQSFLLAQLKQDFELSDKETQILMRGRNAVTRSKNRRNPAAYQDSTSFEALLGYLYIEDPERCCDLLNWLESIVDKIE